MAGADDGGFLSRWARRKAQARQGMVVDDAAAPTAVAHASLPPSPPPDSASAVSGPKTTAIAATAPVQAPTPDSATLPQGPTLEDARALTTASDFSRFVQPAVSAEVRNTALKTLFTDPRFNVMDGLDIYIDDYNKFEPIPPAMLRRMTQSQVLNLFDDELETARGAAHGTPPDPRTDAVPETVSLAGPDPAAATAEPAATTGHPAPDEDPDLRLQPDDAAGPDGPVPGPGEDPGRQP